MLTAPAGLRVLKVRKFDGPAARRLWYRSAGDDYKVSVTGLAFVSSVLRDEKPRPPSFEGQKPCRGFLSRANI